jgi:hypothetical protein
MQSADVAALFPPFPAADRVALVAKLAAAATVLVVVVRAARDRAVRVVDQGAGTRHGC